MGWSNGFGLLSKASNRPIHYRFAKKQRHRINRIVAASSLISNDPVLEPADFDWTAKLAENWETIRDEALSVYRHIEAIPPLREISPDHRRIMEDNS